MSRKIYSHVLYLVIVYVLFSSTQSCFGAAETLYLFRNTDNVLQHTVPTYLFSIQSQPDLDVTFSGELNYVSNGAQSVDVGLLLAACDGGIADVATFTVFLQKNGKDIGERVIYITEYPCSEYYYIEVTTTISISERITPCDEISIRIVSTDGDSGDARFVKMGPGLEEFGKLVFDVTAETTYAPVINAHPADQSVIETEIADFSISADGCPINYQWQKDGVDILDAIESSYTTPATEYGDNGSLFTCVVGDGASISITSDQATLTVGQQIVPVVTQHPEDQIVDEGSTATFSLTATGSYREYQWQKNGVDISGATSQSYTTPVVQQTDDGSEYRCVVSNLRGSAYSNNGTLTVLQYEEHIVDSFFDGARAVFAADVDGDGDLDVLGAAESADDISWWENTDGTGTIWVEHSIDASFDGARSVYGADVDGDGDIDVLGAGYNADTISWWENLDGSGTSWTEHAVAVSFDGASAVYSVDVDGDGDLDVLGAGYNADTISWWENLDGSGTSWAAHMVDALFDGAYSVYSADVDGDGDLDVLGAAYNASDVTWWENTDGTGISWVKHSVDTYFYRAQSVYAADVDGDGDFDVLGAAYGHDDITWWENMDGTGISWSEHTIDASFDGARSVYAADLDNDGDLDVLGAAFDADDISWWENTNGTGTVWKERTVDISFNGASSVFAADINNDDKLDILGAGYYEDDITWWNTPVVVSVPGDVDGSGTADLADAIIVLQICTDIPVSGIATAADVNGDGRLGIAEAIYVINTLSGNE